MYLRTLKKDFKRKKAMNIILLLFISLATMFVSSSVRNIVSVTTALDHYLEMANAPDYFAATMSKAGGTDPEEFFGNCESITDLAMEEIIYMPRSAILTNGELLNVSPNNQMILQGDSDIVLNLFLDDNSILTEVPEGRFYMNSYSMETAGLVTGDKITIELNGISKEFTLAGGFKDAVFGSNMMGLTRLIINSRDFDDYMADEFTKTMLGGRFCYINTGDMDKMLLEIRDIFDTFIFTMDRALQKFTYVFDMVITGLILAVSLILIAIAFVVLRFTITFTLAGEFREIGVMKAIGIGNMQIRGLYLTKYIAISIAGAGIGLILSFPFGRLLTDISSKSVILTSDHTAFINVLCAILVIAVILLFCFGCTGKVNKMTPIDAIRNGQTGERFRKKSFINLGKSRLNTGFFLALNDIFSSPKRFRIIILTYSLCLAIMLMLSTSAATLQSDSLIKTFGVADCDVVLQKQDSLMAYMVEGGRKNLETDLEAMEKNLSENGMPAKCMQEITLSLSVTHDGYESKISTWQGTGTTMDDYDYTEGTAPERKGEIAITKIAAGKIKADIGDTVTIKTADGDKRFIITAFFQTMNAQGSAIRLYSDEEMNYIQASGGLGRQIVFTDHPDDKEVALRMEKLKELYPDADEVMTCAEWVKKNAGVADTLDAVKTMVAVLTIILTALITVLMERSFIAKEQGEIALMKALGIKNSGIYIFHVLRFCTVGMISVIIAEVFAMPVTHLFIDPVFRMMGMELAVEYVINPLEMYILFPLVILVTTIMSTFFTSLCTRKIKSSDMSGTE